MASNGTALAQPQHPAEPLAAQLAGGKRLKLPPNPSSTKLAYEREFAAVALRSGAHGSSLARTTAGDPVAAGPVARADVQVSRVTTSPACQILQDTC